MSAYVVKWAADGDYFQKWEGGIAFWTPKQKDAARFTSAEDARRKTDWGDDEIKIVRLVPRKKS